MICNKEGCMAECRIKDGGEEIHNGENFTKQIYYCTIHNERYAILRKEGHDDIVINL